MQEAIPIKGAEPEEEFADPDDLDGEEREALEASIEQGLEEYRRGEGRPMSELIGELRARR